MRRRARGVKVDRRGDAGSPGKPFPRFSNVWFLRKNGVHGRVRATPPDVALALLICLLIMASPTVLAAGRTLDIEVGTDPDGSMYLRPGNVTVDLGDEVTLRIKNPDRIFHDVALLDYDGNDVEIEVPAGKTETHAFTATVAGDFRLICEVSGHKQKGMFGFLHVVDPHAKEAPGPQLAALALGLGVLALLTRRR